MRTRTYSIVDGRLVNGSRREPGPGDVVIEEVEEFGPGEFGAPLVPDPSKPTRAIVSPAWRAEKAAKARLEQAIAEETRALVLERLAARGVAGAAEEVAKIEAARAVEGEKL